MGEEPILWTPWRMQYVGQPRPPGCVFCLEPASGDDAKAYIVHRAPRTYVILNRFPYNAGHLLLIPYEHVTDILATPAETYREMMDLVRTGVEVLRQVYHPEGFNVGMNLGRAAGAGEIHLHAHIVPRWIADKNFMAVVGDTRVLPETLETTWQRVREAWPAG